MTRARSAACSSRNPAACGLMAANARPNQQQIAIWRLALQAKRRAAEETITNEPLSPTGVPPGPLNQAAQQRVAPASPQRAAAPPDTSPASPQRAAASPQHHRRTATISHSASCLSLQRGYAHLPQLTQAETFARWQRGSGEARSSAEGTLRPRTAPVPEQPDAEQKFSRTLQPVRTFLSTRKASKQLLLATCPAAIGREDQEGSPAEVVYEGLRRCLGPGAVGLDKRRFLNDIRPSPVGGINKAASRLKSHGLQRLR